MPTHVFAVEMSCSGCSSRVDKVLRKLSEVEDVNIDMDGQTVSVVTSLPADTVLAQIQKTGKATTFKETKA